MDGVVTARIIPPMHQDISSRIWNSQASKQLDTAELQAYSKRQNIINSHSIQPNTHASSERMSVCVCVLQRAIVTPALGQQIWTVFDGN